MAWQSTDSEKNKEYAKEIKRLKKHMVSRAYNFEQLEFNLESIKTDLDTLQKEKDSVKSNDLIGKMKNKIEKILDTFSPAGRG
ncbi:MAG: hypothetical protein U5N58_00565 [Actinomycetota bacterium]|nr:hypothetical protein [Actinomycetota bacterium]